ncbi:50S ribosomal protein L13 [Candidatus Wolfebacteria bacterium]|nr:50S ribosomal protein L13 [Candidatus Wolfebacteria bacterium]
MEYKFDATNKKMGRLATEVAEILQGKKNPSYEPRLEGDDVVVVENVDKLSFTGNKFNDKNYYWHTGYIGHLKTATLKELFEKDPKKVFRMVVEKMLPKNRLQSKRLKRLLIK